MGCSPSVSKTDSMNSKIGDLKIRQAILDMDAYLPPLESRDPEKHLLMDFNESPVPPLPSALCPLPSALPSPLPTPHNHTSPPPSPSPSPPSPSPPQPPPTQPRPTDDDRRWWKHRQVDHRVTDRIQTTTNHGMTHLIKKFEHFQKIHFFSQPPPRSQKSQIFITISPRSATPHAHPTIHTPSSHLLHPL